MNLPLISKPRTAGSPSLLLVVSLLVDNPLLTDADLAQATGRTKSFIANIRKSDQFRAELAKRIEEKYGSTKGKLRLELAELALATIERAKNMAASSSVSLPELTQLLKEILPHVGTALGPVPSGTQAPGVQINFVTPEAAARIAEARAASLAMSSTLDPEPPGVTNDQTSSQPALPSYLAQPEYVPEHSSRSEPILAEARDEVREDRGSDAVEVIPPRKFPSPSRRG